MQYVFYSCFKNSYLVFEAVKYVILNLQELQCQDNLLSKSDLDMTIFVRDLKSVMCFTYCTCQQETISKTQIPLQRLCLLFETFFNFCILFKP